MQQNRLILLAALGLACATTEAGAQS
jgi:hypothetical protein